MFVSVRVILGVAPSRVITLPLVVNVPSITTLLEKVEAPPTRTPPPTVAIPANATLPVVTNTVATPEPTFSFDPSNVRFASSSSSPLDPAITTLLSVRSPIAAVSAARLSMLAVPSMNRSCQS